MYWKVQCHEIVCKLRPLVKCLGLNNSLRIYFTLLKLHIKSLRRIKQMVSRSQMIGAGFPSLAKLRSLMLHSATTVIKTWQTALKLSADCQPTHSKLRTMPTVQACGNLLSNLDPWPWQLAAWLFLLWQSADCPPRAAITGLEIGVQRCYS
jgi:hypothetical protein